MRRSVLGLLLLLLALPGTARADSASDVAQALRDVNVYEAPGADLLNEDELNDRLSGTDPRVVVAALPAAAAGTQQEATQRALEIRQALGDPSEVVLVITANQHLGADAGATAAARGVDPQAALNAASHGDDFNKDTVTAFAESFAEQVAAQVGSSGTGPSEPATSSEDHSGTYLLVGLVALVGGLLLFSSRRKRRRRETQFRDQRADVVQLYDRLGGDVMNLDGGSDPVARQALVDASDRYNAAGSALATATTPGELAAARRSALEGLTAAQAARRSLGLDPGPPLPPLQGNGPLLEGDQRIRVGDEEYEGSPSYRPGRGHYFEGGNLGGSMVPGGWYSAPFWTPFLLGSMMSGGGLFGGGYGGYEAGYEEGVEDASSGGDMGGGGDWGGGGDMGGGGDWGGGGDMGGGGDW